MLTKNLKIARRQVSILLGDLIVFIITPLVAVNLYFFIQLGPRFTILNLKADPVFFIPHITIFISVLYLFDQYNFQKNFINKETLLQIIAAITCGGILTNFCSFILGIPQQGRGIFIVFCILIFLGVILVRILYSILGSVGIYDKRTLIVGCGESGKRILKLLHDNDYSRIKIIGFTDNNPDKDGLIIDEVPVFLQEKSIKDTVRQLQPQLLIIAMRRNRFYALNEDLIWCAQQGMEIWDLPTAYEYLEKRIPLQYVDEIWLLFSAIHWPRMHIRRLKRIVDILFSVSGLLLSAPLTFITAATIWMESGSPIFLLQKRIGKNGQLINLIKFRSMYHGNPKKGEKGTLSNDNRVTRVGRVIRKLHIDEIPQLINVLKGDLSMVGPRPELIDFVREYIGKSLEEASWEAEPLPRDKKSPPNISPVKADIKRPGNYKSIIPYIEQRFTVQQGITGWAQVMQPYVSSTYEDMVKKLEYDLYYIKNMSFLLDLIILLKTVKIVLLGRGK